MDKNRLGESELILSEDGRIYHLNLRPEDIATTIITVGDPNRVNAVSRHFDSIELKVDNREITTHTGYLQGKRLSVVSTGMGTDNIDIVFNELDALVNIDFNTRTIKDDKTSLTIVRVGTSGSLQEDIPVDSFVASSFGFGFDSLMHFYQRKLSEAEEELTKAALDYFSDIAVKPYVAGGTPELINKFASGCHPGITVTCPGFYGPQGRVLRAIPKYETFIDRLGQFRHGDLRVTNFEMETAGIYGVGNLLGHKVCSLNVIVANRIKKQFTNDAKKTVENLIEFALENLLQD